MKRLAYEIRPYKAAGTGAQAHGGTEKAKLSAPPPPAAPLSAADVRTIVEEFLGARQLTRRGT